jgi:hypothetical protein
MLILNILLQNMRLKNVNKWYAVKEGDATMLILPS